MQNKKVRNATPNEYNGIKFRSKIETYTYQQLHLANIPVEYEKHKFVLLPKFEFNGEKVRAMTYTPDFVGDNFIIECKGQANDAFPLRWKLFKYILAMDKAEVQLYIVRNQKEVRELVEKLKQERK